MAGGKIVGVITSRVIELKGNRVPSEPRKSATKDSDSNIFEGSMFFFWDKLKIVVLHSESWYYK